MKQWIALFMSIFCMNAWASEPFHGYNQLNSSSYTAAQPLPSEYVTIQNDQWYIMPPSYSEPMVFSQQQIESIMAEIAASMNHDPQALLTNASGNESMIQIVNYIAEHSITPNNLSSHLANRQLPEQNNVQYRYEGAMNRMRQLVHNRSHGIIVSQVSFNRKILSYRHMQKMGNVSKLEFERREIERNMGLFHDTRLEKQLNVINNILKTDITHKLNVVRTGSLQDAQAVIAELKAHWPYSKSIVTSIQERQAIQAYLDKVGFNELQAAQNLLELRSDYYRMLADKIYNGESVTLREAELAKKAYDQMAYKQMAQQRELRIKELNNNPDLLPQYKDFLIKHPGELKHIPVDGKIVSADEFREWCDNTQQLDQQHNIASKIDFTQSVQSHITKAFNECKYEPGHTQITQKLDETVDAVLAKAALHNCVVHPEVDWRLQAALKALPKSVDVKDFTFQVATVEHLLHDIHAITAQAAHKDLTLAQRSPELLTRSIGKYFEYLAPTENEISFIGDLARYISDATIGTDYLSAEVREHRIAQFWDTVNNISIENLSNVSAEQVIDTMTYVAARATYAWGASATVSVVKNLKNVGAVAARSTAQGAAVFADRFVKVFDSVIAANPAIITNEGTVIWSASQEAAAEARQLVQAFDGVKDKLAGKKSSEILDDTKKVLEKEKEIKLAKTPVGRRGNPMGMVSKNSSKVINGTKFTGHALDQMQSRGVLSPSAVLDIVKNPAKVLEGNEPGIKLFIRDNLKIVVNEVGDIITVILQ